MSYKKIQIEDVENTQNIPLDFFDIKVGSCYVKYPYTEDQSKIVVKKDSKGNDIKYIEHMGKLRQILKVQQKDGKPVFFYLRVLKEEVANAATTSLPFFILPPELEKHFGMRADTITDVYFVNDEIDEILEGAHIKHESGQVACIGTGKWARRYNPYSTKKDKWEEVPCKCAYSKYYTADTGEPIAEEVAADTLKEEEIRVWEKKDGNQTQVLVQGAWRNVKRLENGIYHLQPLEPTCEVNFTLYALCSLASGVKLMRFRAKGRDYYNRVKSQLSLIKTILNSAGLSLAGQEMILKVFIRKTNKKGKGTQKRPNISIEYTKSLDDLMKEMERKNKDRLLTASTTMDEDVEIPDEDLGNEEVEDTPYTVLDEDDEDYNEEGDDGEEEVSEEEEPPQVEEPEKKEEVKEPPPPPEKKVEDLDEKVKEYMDLLQTRKDMKEDEVIKLMQDNDIDPWAKPDNAVLFLKEQLIKK